VCSYAGRNAISSRPDSVATDPAMDQIAPVSRYDDASAWATPTFCEIQNNVQVRAAAVAVAVLLAVILVVKIN